MKTEDLHNDMEVSQLSDEVLDDVVGGVIHQNTDGLWDVIDDKTSKVVQSFGNRQAAIAYAKKNGISTKIV